MHISMNINSIKSSLTDKIYTNLGPPRLAFRDFKTSLQASFLAIFLLEADDVCLNTMPFASTSVVMEVTPLSCDTVAGLCSKCSFWHNSFNSFTGWNFIVSGVIRGSNSGLILRNTACLSYPESTNIAPASDSIISASTW